MELDSKLSCDGFPSDTTTSSKTGVVYPCADHSEKKTEKPPELLPDASCSQMLSSSSSTTTTISTGYFNSECRLAPTHRQDPPNIGYEMAIAKSILQQYSTLSGDNLFDHLSDIIKRVIDERPPNVIDFFEEFSRNVREQKFHLPERFPPDAIYEESRMYRVAKKLLLSMKLPMPPDPDELAGAEDISEDNKSALIEDLKLEISETQRLFITFSERIQHLQFFWNQCGFGINPDDIFQLACAMDRLQTHPSILQCRFWGVINGLKASYYVVEASLTREEITLRYDQMMDEMKSKHHEMLVAILKRDEVKPLPSHIGPELTPGAFGWENFPPEELEAMEPAAAAIPLVEVVDVFNVPPEMVGLGVNRFSYFVVNAVSNDWIELPIVTPKQIIVSRKIKKFLTGDLEAEVTSYPCFPGKEKHYLRALIARITAGTYIAPYGYYRKMTKRERRLYEGLEDEEEEEEEEEEAGEGEEEEGEVDNDIYLLKNEKYDAQPLTTLTSPTSWVHVRPNILNQGRVVWFDEEKARRDREKELARMLKMQLAEEMGEEEEEEEAEEEGEGEEEGLLEGFNPPEIGPPILNCCSFDQSDEYTIPWVSRFTSKYTNKPERILIMQSNVWPGAYTFTFGSLCESIYMGWGHKYVSRNMAFDHLPSIVQEYPHTMDDFIETIDPTVEEEEAYRLYLLRKQKRPDDDDEGNLSEFEDDQEFESGSDAN